MTNLLRDGDYVPDGFGGFVRLQAEQAVLQQALFRLNCRRGRFPFLPTLGSELHTLCREKSAQRSALAKQYCIQALQGLPVQVERVELTQTDGDSLALSVWLRWMDETLSLEVTI